MRLESPVNSKRNGNVQVLKGLTHRGTLPLMIGSSRGWSFKDLVLIWIGRSSKPRQTGPIDRTSFPAWPVSGTSPVSFSVQRQKIAPENNCENCKNCCWRNILHIYIYTWAAGGILIHMFWGALFPRDKMPVDFNFWINSRAGQGSSSLAWDSTRHFARPQLLPKAHLQTWPKTSKIKRFDTFTVTVYLILLSLAPCTRPLVLLSLEIPLNAGKIEPRKIHTHPRTHVAFVTPMVKKNTNISVFPSKRLKKAYLKVPGMPTLVYVALVTWTLQKPRGAWNTSYINSNIFKIWIVFCFTACSSPLLS